MASDELDSKINRVAQFFIGELSSTDVLRLGVHQNNSELFNIYLEYIDTLREIDRIYWAKVKICHLEKEFRKYLDDRVANDPNMYDVYSHALANLHGRESKDRTMSLSDLANLADETAFTTELLDYFQQVYSPKELYLAEGQLQIIGEAYVDLLKMYRIKCWHKIIERRLHTPFVNWFMREAQSSDNDLTELYHNSIKRLYRNIESIPQVLRLASS